MEILVGVLGFVSILVLMGIGAHISVAIGLPAIIGLFFLLGVPQTFEVVSSRMFSLATDYSFTAIPLFLLMGYIAMVSGITKSAFDCAAVWLRRIPGGLAMAACVASVPIGACMGSGVPATVALSKMAIPEMIDHNYDKGLAAGTIAATATIASLVPPSIMMVVYAIYAQVSLGQMLLAGYIPAILTIVIYLLSIAIRVRVNPSLAPERRSNKSLPFSAYIKALKGMWGIVVLFAVLFVSIYSGLFTATEAAALAAFTAFILMIIMGKFKWPILRDGFKEAIGTTVVLFILLISSAVFVVFIDVTGLPRLISDSIVAADMSLYGFLAIIMIVYLIMGVFLPSIASLLLTIPVLLPVMISMDINLIWFGILFIKMSEVGAITPPFGMSVFIVKGVVGDKIKMGEIFKGISWFLVCEIVALILLMAFPIISLWLPGKLG
jgi:tripartite ATP-independent transporter DctM subunit